MDASYVELAGEWEGSGALRAGGRLGNLDIRADAISGRTVLRHRKKILRQWADPLAALQWMASSFAEAGDWVGYLSYDLGRWFERLPVIARDDLGLPLFAFTFIPAAASPAISPPARPAHPSNSNSAGVSTFSRDTYRQAVARCIDYIGAGDVFQVNLSQRLSFSGPPSPVEVYRSLQNHAPAIYGALLDFGDFALASNSPELFLRITPDATTGRRRIVTRPIKGTRPRAAGMEVELRDSPKDQAELNMIVDLERNDLGRVCEVGSVQVTQPRAIESHPTVYHGVATVEGRLRSDVTFVDLLRATFPGGSVTGAPKIRAMEIIDELEPVCRGPYCGAIGYLSSDGRIELNVAIRTLVFIGDRVHVHVGGGIVADSDPDAEYEETLVKARAMLRAIDRSAPT